MLKCVPGKLYIENGIDEGLVWQPQKPCSKQKLVLDLIDCPDMAGIYA